MTSKILVSKQTIHSGGAGMYVPRNVLDTGAAEGAAMEYYKSYNASVLAELVRANDRQSASVC